MKKGNDKRIFYLDFLRFFACLSVIMIHSSSSYNLKVLGSTEYWIGCILNNISKLAIPLFIMISGALMLDENYTFNIKKIINHIKKMIIFFLFWSSFYCVVFQIINPILHNESIKLTSILGNLIKGCYHLWFIYLIIGLYLILPLLRLWVNKKNKRYVEYFLILGLIFTIIFPQISIIGNIYNHNFSYMNEILEYINIKYVSGYILYFVLGWYLNNFKIKREKLIYILGIIGLFINITMPYLTTVYTSKTIDFTNPFYLNILLYTSSFFILSKKLFSKKRKPLNKYSKFISIIAKYSLGIYAIHALGIYLSDLILLKINLGNLSIIFTFMFTFFLSYILTFILSKIPIIKNIV